MRTKKSAHPRVAVLFEVIPKKESKPKIRNYHPIHD